MNLVPEGFEEHYLDRCKHCGNDAAWRVKGWKTEGRHGWEIACSVCGIKTNEAYSEEGLRRLVFVWNLRSL